MEYTAMTKRIRKFLENERISYKAWDEFFEVDIYGDVYLFERMSLRTWMWVTPVAWKRFNGSQSVIDFIDAML